MCVRVCVCVCVWSGGEEGQGGAGDLGRGRTGRGVRGHARRAARALRQLAHSRNADSAWSSLPSLFQVGVALGGVVAAAVNAADERVVHPLRCSVQFVCVCCVLCVLWCVCVCVCTSRVCNRHGGKAIACKARSFAASLFPEGEPQYVCRARVRDSAAPTPAPQTHTVFMMSRPSCRCSNFEA